MSFLTASKNFFLHCTNAETIKCGENFGKTMCLIFARISNVFYPTKKTDPQSFGLPTHQIYQKFSCVLANISACRLEYLFMPKLIIDDMN